MNGRFAVLSNRNFARYFAAQSLSAVGDGMQFIAMSWLLYSQTGSVASIGWFLVVTSLPNILLAPWSGVLVDRWDVRKICVAMDGLRGLIFCALALLFFVGSVPTYLIYAAEFAVVCCNSFYQPASAVLIRNLVPSSDLLAANVMRSMGSQIGMLVGAGLGGLLMAGFGVGIVIIVNVLSFAASGLLTLLIAQQRAAATGAHAASRQGMLGEFAEGLRYVWRNAYLLAVAAVMAAIYLTLYVCNTLLPAFAGKVIAVGAQGFGLIDACWAVGAITSGVVLTYIGSQLRQRHQIPLALLALACAILVFTSAQGLLQAMLGYFLLGLITSFVRVKADTLVQMNVDPRYLGRVSTTIGMLISWLSLATYVGVGYLGDALSIRWIYLALAFMVACAALPSFFLGRDKTANAMAALNRAP